jgi:hypothetical protein
MSGRKRKGLSKSVRFEIFKRDGFRCHYCGATPDRALLRVDHVEPVAHGGSNEPHNLITACHDCNAGKSATPLGVRKLAPSSSPDDAKEQAEQIRAYLSAQREICDAKKELLADFTAHWEGTVGWTITPTERASAKRFLDRLPVQFVWDAVIIAAGKVPADSAYRSNQTFLYFCGICWKQIKASDAAAESAKPPPIILSCSKCRKPIASPDDGVLMLADVECVGGQPSLRVDFPGNGPGWVEDGEWEAYRRMALALHDECSVGGIAYNIGLARMGEDWESHLHTKVWWVQTFDDAVGFVRRAFGITRRPRAT